MKCRENEQKQNEINIKIIVTTNRNSSSARFFSLFEVAFPRESEIKFINISCYNQAGVARWQIYGLPLP